MSSYNTTTISNVFTRLYTSLRRVYSQYAANYSVRQYLVFCNVVLQRPDRIPYFSSAAAAQNKSNPAGYLPTDISAYYFKERPVYFFNLQQFMDWRIGAKQGWSLTGSNPPYVILNLYLNNKYQDVYVNYDSSKMNIELYALDAILFVDQEKNILALQTVIETICKELCVCYNQLKLLQQAQAAGKYNNQAFITKWTTKVNSWIDSLQRDSRFVIKVCRECNSNAYLGNALLIPTTGITYITMAGAVSLTWMTKSYAQYDSAKYFADEQLIEVERLRIELDMQWKTLGGYTGPVDSGVKAMDTVTTTATIPKKKNSNWLWIVFAAVGVGVLASGNNNNRRDKN